MKETALALREERAKDFEKAKAILEGAEKENRNLNAEEQQSYDRIMVAITEKKSRIDRIEAAEKIESELTESRGRIISEKEDRTPSTDEVKTRGAEYAKAFRKYLITGDKNELRAYGAVGTDNVGGYTVPDEWVKEVEVSLLAFGGMREAATVIKTAGVGSLFMPTSNDTGNSGAILAENTAVSEQEVTFGQLQLDAFKYTSKMERFSVELLQDSAINIAEFVAGRLAERIARILNTHFTTGDGSSKPQGVVTASGLGKTAAGAAAITTDELIDLLHSLDPAYRPGASFMMKDSTVQLIRKLKDTTNQYLWQPGLQAGVADKLLGYPVIVNQDMAAATTGNKSVVFGNLKKYIIRDVNDFRLVRMNERFAEYDQIALVAFSRHDGDLLDAGTDPVKHLIQA